MKKKKVSPVMFACLKGSSRALEYLLTSDLIEFDVQQMFDVHVNDKGESFIHLAAKLNKEVMLQRLINHVLSVEIAK